MLPFINRASKIIMTLFLLKIYFLLKIILFIDTKREMHIFLQIIKLFIQ